MTTEEPKQKPPILVRGQRVGLGPAAPRPHPDRCPLADRPGSAARRGHSGQVSTVETTEAWFEQATKPESTDVHFTVYDPDDLAPVGTAVLVRVDQHAGTAEFGITIGERRNQGLGTEATKLVLDWAFTVIGLHNVLLVTFSWNLPAIRAYAKAGFREIAGGEEAIPASV